MQQINSYIYDNTVVVQLDTDPTIEQRNRVVYTRTIQLYGGVDNIIKVKVQNADQKPYDVTNHALIFTIIDDYVVANANVVYMNTVNIANARLGTGSVTIEAGDLVKLTRNQYTYAIQASDGLTTVATYVDDNWGARGQLFIDNSAYPDDTIVPTGDFITDFGTLICQ